MTCAVDGIYFLCTLNDVRYGYFGYANSPRETRNNHVLDSRKSRVHIEDMVSDVQSSLKGMVSNGNNYRIYFRDISQNCQSRDDGLTYLPALSWLYHQGCHIRDIRHPPSLVCRL